MDRAIKPRLRDLAELVAALLDCDVRDARVARSVASIQVLSTMALPHPIRDRLGARIGTTPDDVTALADHVADFSIAGIRAVGAGSKAAVARRGSVRRRPVSPPAGP